MTNEKALAIFWEERYKHLQDEYHEEIDDRETKIKHLQGWLGLMIGANLSVTIPVIAWVVS